MSSALVRAAVLSRVFFPRKRRGVRPGRTPPPLPGEKREAGERRGDTWRPIMNVYELVTAKIVERLEEGVIPWRKCWTSGPAKSLTTGKEYRGLNSLLLGMREYSSRYWVTFKQAQKASGHVKKGEKAT